MNSDYSFDSSHEDGPALLQDDSSEEMGLGAALMKEDVSMNSDSSKSSLKESKESIKPVEQIKVTTRRGA